MRSSHFYIRQMYSMGRDPWILTLSVLSGSQYNERMLLNLLAILVETESRVQLWLLCTCLLSLAREDWDNK